MTTRSPSGDCHVCHASVASCAVIPRSWTGPVDATAGIATCERADAACETICSAMRWPMVGGGAGTADSTAARAMDCPTDWPRLPQPDDGAGAGTEATAFLTACPAACP